VLTAIFKVSLLFLVVEAIGQLKWLWLVKCNKLSDVERFSEASRGPLGAALLLGRMKGRYVLNIFNHPFGEILTYLGNFLHSGLL
jgi:hypothetical protein